MRNQELERRQESRLAAGETAGGAVAALAAHEREHDYAYYGVTTFW